MSIRNFYLHRHVNHDSYNGLERLQRFDEIIDHFICPPQTSLLRHFELQCGVSLDMRIDTEFTPVNRANTIIWENCSPLHRDLG